MPMCIFCIPGVTHGEIASISKTSHDLAWLSFAGVYKYICTYTNLHSPLASPPPPPVEKDCIDICTIQKLHRKYPRGKCSQLQLWGKPGCRDCQIKPCYNSSSIFLVGSNLVNGPYRGKSDVLGLYWYSFMTLSTRYINSLFIGR